LSLCRLNDYKVGEVPGKRGCPPPFRLAAIALDCGGVTAPFVRAAIPREDHGEFARFRFERIESAKRSATDDDFDGIPVDCARGEGFLTRRRNATFG